MLRRLISQVSFTINATGSPIMPTWDNMTNTHSISAPTIFAGANRLHIVIHPHFKQTLSEFCCQRVQVGSDPMRPISGCWGSVRALSHQLDWRFTLINTTHEFQCVRKDILYGSYMWFTHLHVRRYRSACHYQRGCLATPTYIASVADTSPHTYPKIPQYRM